MSEYRRTIDALAQEIDATVLYDAKPLTGHAGPRANSGTRTVHALPIEGVPAEAATGRFWVVMHELGHLFYKHVGRNAFDRAFGVGGDAENEREAQAWQWAIENAGHPVDDVGRSVITFALASYLATNDLAIGPTMLRLIETLGPESPKRDAIADTFGEDMARHFSVASRAWDFAVRKAGDIKSAA